MIFPSIQQFVLLSAVLDIAFRAHDEDYTPNPTGDISYKRLVNRDPDCASYVGTYRAIIQDHQQGTSLACTLEITSDDTKCTFRSNNIPNHDVGGDTTNGQDFSSAVAPNQEEFVLYVPRNPEKARRKTYVRRQAAKLTLNGIMLNGVDLDMDSSFCYHPEYDTHLNIALGTPDGNIRCGLFAEWFAVPAANPENVVLDEYTGHAFNGRYHYHGDNDALSNVAQEGDILQAADLTGPNGSPVIGFAPDGFPIYGHYFFDEEAGELRKAQSSYKVRADFQNGRLKPDGGELDPPPIDTHELGIFVQDWEWVEGSGDLDECNGMTDSFGQYGYYYTETYPYGPLCSSGAPDPSFTKESAEFVADTDPPAPEPELTIFCNDGVSTIDLKESVSAVLTSKTQGSRQIQITGISGWVTISFARRIYAHLSGPSLSSTLSHGQACDTMMYQTVSCSTDASSCIVSPVYDSTGKPIAVNLNSGEQVSESSSDEVVWEGEDSTTATTTTTTTTITMTTRTTTTTTTPTTTITTATACTGTTPTTTKTPTAMATQTAITTATSTSTTATGSDTTVSGAWALPVSSVVANIVGAAVTIGALQHA